MNTKKGKDFNRLTQLTGFKEVVSLDWDLSVNEEAVDYYVNWVKRFHYLLSFEGRHSQSFSFRVSKSQHDFQSRPKHKL